MKYISVVMCFFVMSIYTGASQHNSNNIMEQNNIHKQLIQDCYRRIFGQGDIAFADSVLQDDYIQHSPMVKTGKQGFMAFFKMMSEMPKPANPQKPFTRYICDGNFVAVHLQVEFMGKQNAVVDLYRLENGKLAEHWDAAQDIPTKNTNNNEMVVGVSSILDIEQTSGNKEIVANYLSEVVIGKQFSGVSRYIDENVVQHNPNIAGGIFNILDFHKQLNITKVHRLIGQGNFVVSQCEGYTNGKQTVVFDIFRLENEMVVEHWSVIQQVPEQMAHDNGMF